MMKMQMPPLLQEGDTIAVTAASGPCDPVRLAAGVRTIENCLNLNVRVLESCHASHGYLAGTDAQRINDLHTAFADKKIKGIFMARGGYGAARLLPYLDYDLIRQNPKVFVGFSDVTALHTAINQICKLITFHGPMPATNFATETPDPFTLSTFKKMVFKSPATEKAIFTIPTSYASTPIKTLVPGRAAAPLTGGNLTLLAASLGTPYEIKTRGRILFMEEIQEEPYRVDRLFLQLKQAGKFRNAKGIILGDFSPETPETLNQAIQELIIPEGKPTIANLPCGHTTPTLTLPLGQLTTFG